MYKKKYRKWGGVKKKISIECVKVLKVVFYICCLYVTSIRPCIYCTNLLHLLFTALLGSMPSGFPLSTCDDSKAESNKSPVSVYGGRWNLPLLPPL